MINKASKYSIKDDYSSNRCVISPHHVPNPSVMMRAAVKDRKHKIALPTASRNAERNVL